MSHNWVWDDQYKRHRFWSPEHNQWIYEENEAPSVPQPSSTHPQPRPLQTQTPSQYQASPVEATPRFTTPVGASEVYSAQQPASPPGGPKTVDYGLTGSFQRLNLQHGINPQAGPSTGVYGSQPLSQSRSTGPYGAGPTAPPRPEVTVTNATSDLDPGFQYRNHDFFKPGKIIKVLWPEIIGSTNTSQNLAAIMTDPIYGEPFTAKFQWFAILRDGKFYCSCLPISTFGGRGVAKKQLVKYEHAIIYTSRKPPAPKSNELPHRDGRGRRTERGMREPPIQVRPKSGEQGMDPMSRINFNKPTTLQKNVKIYDYGVITEKSLPDFF